MAELKTRPNAASADEFIRAIPDDARRRDCLTIVELMKHATGSEPAMWGDSIIGFGQYHYKYDSGREGDWFLTGLSPRKSALTLYIMAGFDRYEDLMARLGRHRTGKSCLYLRKLADVDMNVLRELIEASVEHVRRTHSA